MKIEIEELGGCQKKLQIVVPEDMLSPETEKKYREISKSVKIPGFRKGKVPRNLLEQQYGKRVRSDVIKEVIPSALAKAMEEKNLKVVGRPMIDDVNMEPGQPCSFSVTVDVYPEFELADFSNLEMTRDIVEVTVKDVEEQLQGMREDRAVMESDPEKIIETGDYVLFDINGLAKGESNSKKKQLNRTAIVGKDETLPEIEKALMGMKKGDSKNITIDIPPGNAEAGTDEATSGKKRDYVIKVNEVKIRNLPDLNDEFAKEVSKSMNITDLKKRLMDDLMNFRFNEATAQLKTSVIDRLIRENSFDLPDSLIEAQMKWMSDQVGEQLTGQGIDKNNMKRSPEQQKEMRDKAERAVRAELIIDKIATSKGIKVNEDELNKEIKKLAESNKMSFEVVKRRLEEQKNVETIRHQLFVNKSYDALLGMVKITDKIITKVNSQP